MHVMPWLQQLSQSYRLIFCARQRTTKRKYRSSSVALEHLESRVLLAADGDFGFAFSLRGAAGATQGGAITTDLDGNMIVSGLLGGTVDFDPGTDVFELTTPPGQPNGFIAKYTSDGRLLWAKALTGGSVLFQDMTTDSDGNIYATGNFPGTGSFSGAIDFDPGPGIENRTSQGATDAFVLKLNSDGEFLFATTVGGPGNENSRKITVDSEQNVYTTGSFEDTVDFDAGSGIQNHTSQGALDIFISKLDRNGNFVFTSTIGNVPDGPLLNEGTFGIAVDSIGNVYTSGGFYGTLDFDPGAGVQNRTSNGSADSFILKLDPSGSYVSVWTLGGATADQALAITLDSDNNIYYSGGFTGTADLDPGAGEDLRTAESPAATSYVSKLDPDGNLVWASLIGGTGGSYAAYLAIDSQHNVYTSGFFANTIDLDPGVDNDSHTSHGGLDVLAYKLDANGNLVYGASLGGTSNDMATAIAVDRDGNAYLTGNFSGIVDFDPGPDTYNLNSGGVQANGFVLKLRGPAVDLSVSSATGTEAAQTQITVTVTADQPVIRDQYIDLAVAGVGITLGDYTITDDDAGLAGIQVKILAGQTTGTVTLTIVNDNLIEATETAVLTILNPSSGIHLGSTIEKNIMIADNDFAEISLGSATTTEGGILSFEVTLSNPIDVAVTANLSTVDGTATTANNDYTPRDSSIELFAPGATTATVSVNTTADGTVEPDEALSLILSSLSAGGRNVIFNGGSSTLSATGTILNDDTPPTLTISPDATLTSAATVLFTLTFSRPMTDFTVEDISLTNGTAGTFTETSPGIYTLIVTPLADGLVSVNVDAGKAHDAGGNPNPAANASATVDQTGPVFSTPTSLEVAENTTDIETAAATDAHGPVTYSLVESDDSPLFSINTTTGVLTFLTAPDFEDPADADGNNAYVLQVRATDSLNVSTIQTLAVTVTGVNDNSPLFTSGASFQVTENTTIAGTVAATDADLPEQTITFSITGGADGSLFEISNAGVLTFHSAPDFETPGDADDNNVYEVQVTAADGQGLTETQLLTVTITNAGEGPQLSNVTDVTWTKARPATTIKVLPSVVVSSSESLAGGTLTLVMNTLGSKRKSADTLQAVSVSSIGTGGDFVYSFANQTLTLQIELGEQATAAKVQSFLRGITFITKGKGLKTLTRSLHVTLTDGSNQTDSVTQTIHVKKKADAP